MAASKYQPGGAAGITGITSQHKGLGAGYSVSLPLFEGPLDLLLHLIEQEKLDINEISLVAVTDQYLKPIEQLEELAPGALADFLVVASRLLYIKSTRILPKPAEAGDEAEESSETLIRHLLEYRQFRRAASELREREDDGNRLFVRPPTAVDLSEIAPKSPEFGEVDVNLLQNALRRALARTPVEAPPPQVKPYAVTVAERIEGVRSKLDGLRQQEESPREVTFSELLEEGHSRIEIIVTFLAVLELVKQREVLARQDATFGEIVLLVVDPAELVPDGGESEVDGLEEENELAPSSEPQERSAKDPRA
jgi:segregation and condensation protein A